MLNNKLLSSFKKNLKKIKTKTEKPPICHGVTDGDRNYFYTNYNAELMYRISVIKSMQKNE
jgi:hypothetical protein